MEKRLALCALLLLLLSSCNPLEETGREESRTVPGTPAISSVRAGGPSPAPLATGEEIACTHYVTPGGDDAAPGSELQPWDSFQHGVASAQPGDTICFRDGVHAVTETVPITQSGTEEAPITLIAYPGERPIVDGGGQVGDLMVVGEEVSYVRISGLTLRNFTVWGLGLNGDNRHIVLDHLAIEGGEAGVHFTYGSDDLAPPDGGPVEHIILEDSRIVGSEYTGVDCMPGPCNHMVFRRIEVTGSGLAGQSSFGADGISVSRGYPLLVEDCYIHDNGGDGIDLNSRDRAGHATGVIVRRNRVAGNHQNGIKLWAGGRIVNNVVAGQGNSALWLGTFHSNVEVVNNTVAFNMWDPAFSGRNWAFSAGYPEEFVALPEVELVLVNNIFAFNTGPQVGEPTGIYLGPGVAITEHHNLYFSREDQEITAEFLARDISRQELGDGTWTALTGQGQGDLTDDPSFTSAWPEVDVSLRPTSPAIDAGDDAFCPAVDHLGNPRPVDGDGDGEAACDVGAFEAR